jgi:3-methyladenine DNA glycosylase Mpg
MRLIIGEHTLRLGSGKRSSVIVENEMYIGIRDNLR